MKLLVIFFVLAMVSTCLGDEEEVVIETQSQICSLDTKKLLHFRWSWISIENTQDLDVDETETTLNGTKIIELDMCNANDERPYVSRLTSYACKMQPNLCKLNDGILYYYNAGDNCFTKVDDKKYPWGYSYDKKPLERFVSAAASDIPIGTLLEIEDLKGLQMPNSTVLHNGCVRVDQNCSAYCKFGCKEIELYMGLYAYYKAITWPEPVEVIEANCTILNYDDITRNGNNAKHNCDNVVIYCATIFYVLMHFLRQND